MDYKNEFKKAVYQTWELGLTLYTRPLPLLTNAIPKEDLNPVLFECISLLRKNGYISSIELNRNCVNVHLLIKEFLLRIFNLETYITIGSMHGNGWDYCAMTYKYILQELASPNTNHEIKAHAWLTLPDGSIIDWTGQAWYDLQVGEVHDVENCMVFLSPNEFREDHYYQPYLVGEDFLIRTGTIGPA